jgi:glycosyltransferase involved in cell wall biosynthesis
MLSFVVPAYNEEKYLGPTLESIHAAAREVGEAYEIVVADDASNDATAIVAEEGGARVVRVEKRQIAATRNAGARAGAGNRIVFIDADTHLNAAVLRAALKAMDEGAVGGGAGVAFDQAPRVAQFVARSLVVPAFRWIGWAAGCFIFCRRDAFEAAGGFDETYFAAEEIFFSQALKNLGRFVVLREHVVSSGRKFEGRSTWSILAFMFRQLSRGFRGVKSRETTEFWYPEKR